MVDEGEDPGVKMAMTRGLQMMQLLQSCPHIVNCIMYEHKHQPPHSGAKVSIYVVVFKQLLN